ncbi:MAG: MATE family efflux transporter [Gemmataceae bacterium]
MGQPQPEPGPGAGGSRELLKLALPLIVSNSFLTLQLTIDRVMLSRQNSDAVGAAMVAAVMYWTPFALLQFTASYAATFVAQYVGAGRPNRVGPAVWQALYFGLAAGLLFLLLRPLAGPLMALAGHDARVQTLEVAYFQVLCFAALPMLVVAATNAFFAGRGDTWPVLLTDGIGVAVNATLCYAWINGHWGFPALGIVGAGWATVCSACVAAVIGLAQMLRAKHRRAFATLSGWRPDRELFLRMMRFGLPSGMQYFLEAMAFNIFLVLMGRLGATPLAASSIAFTINTTALVPMLGLSQAVSVLVGQRLGMNRPDLAAKTTLRGVGWCLLYTLANAIVFVGIPGPLLLLFQDSDAQRWAAVGPLVPGLLRFVAVYCLFECVSLVLSAALRGAGDTRFVSLATLAFSWAVMVLPALLASRYGGGLYLNWVFATAYLIVLSFVFVWRFRQGKWRSMRVIEAG